MVRGTLQYLALQRAIAKREVTSQDIIDARNGVMVGASGLAICQAWPWVTVGGQMTWQEPCCAEMRMAAVRVGALRYAGRCKQRAKQKKLRRESWDAYLASRLHSPVEAKSFSKAARKEKIAAKQKKLLLANKARKRRAVLRAAMKRPAATVRQRKPAAATPAVNRKPAAAVQRKPCRAPQKVATSESPATYESHRAWQGGATLRAMQAVHPSATMAQSRVLLRSMDSESESEDWGIWKGTNTTSDKFLVGGVWMPGGAGACGHCDVCAVPKRQWTLAPTQAEENPQEHYTAQLHGFLNRKPQVSEASSTSDWRDVTDHEGESLAKEKKSSPGKWQEHFCGKCGSGYDGPDRPSCDCRAEAATKEAAGGKVAAGESEQSAALFAYLRAAGRLERASYSAPSEGPTARGSGSRSSRHCNYCE